MSLKNYSEPVLAALTLGAMLAISPIGSGTAAAVETMTDRCSQRVAIPATYGGQPDSVGTVVLTRPTSGYSPWTAPFRVATGDGGRIRWWCNSTRGNFFDLGTWDVKVNWLNVFTCAYQILSDGKVTCLSGVVKADPGARAYKGWTAERSRCSNRGGLIRARLGPDRLLQIECLGR